MSIKQHAHPLFKKDSVYKGTYNCDIVGCTAHTHRAHRVGPAVACMHEQEWLQLHMRRVQCCVLTLCALAALERCNSALSRDRASRITGQSNEATANRMQPSGGLIVPAESDLRWICSFLLFVCHLHSDNCGYDVHVREKKKMRERGGKHTLASQHPAETHPIPLIPRGQDGPRQMMSRVSLSVAALRCLRGNPSSDL